MKPTYEEQLESKEWQDKRQQILERDGHKCSLCGKTKHLNVHHKYYILGHLAWEYEDETFVTLCQKCHKRIHKVSKIVAYKDDRMTIVNTQLTPCYRCGGTGYFSEFKHIQYGICFRCKGACFEEFLEESDKKEYEVIKSTEEKFGFEDNIDDYDYEPIGYDEEYEKKIIEEILSKKKTLIPTGFYNEHGIPTFKIEYAKDSQEFDVFNVLYDISKLKLIKSYNSNTLIGVYTIKEGTKTIGKNAFDQIFVDDWDCGARYLCFGFNQIVIPDSVEEIEDHAFNSENIKDLKLPISLRKVGDYAFASTSIEIFTLPEKVYFVGESLFANCESLHEIHVSQRNKMYDSRNNCNAIINTHYNTIVASCSTTIIPENVEGIEAGAFESIRMDSLIIPKSVKWIDYNAFKDCKISKLYLPDSVEQIQNNWYDYNENIEQNEIHIPLSLFEKHIEAFIEWYSIIKITDESGVKIEVISMDEFIYNTDTIHITVFDNGRVLFSDRNNFRYYAIFCSKIPKENRNEIYLQEKRQHLSMVTISTHDWTKSFIAHH